MTSILFFGICIGFVIEYFIIDKYGLIGISITKLIIFILIFVTTFVYAQSLYKIKMEWNKFFIFLLILISNFIVAFTLNYSFEHLIYKIFIFIISMAILYSSFMFIDKKYRGYSI